MALAAMPPTTVMYKIHDWHGTSQWAVIPESPMTPDPAGETDPQEILQCLLEAISSGVILMVTVNISQRTAEEYLDVHNLHLGTEVISKVHSRLTLSLANVACIAIWNPTLQLSARGLKIPASEYVSTVASKATLSVIV
jgi:hypothetical protein